MGDGWYRSCSGVGGDRNLYGEDVALYFQLEVEGKVVCVSDEAKCDWCRKTEEAKTYSGFCCTAFIFGTCQPHCRDILFKYKLLTGFRQRIAGNDGFCVKTGRYLNPKLISDGAAAGIYRNCSCAYNCGFPVSCDCGCCL